MIQNLHQPMINQIKDVGEKGINQHDLFLLDSQNSTKNSMSAEKLRKYQKGTIFSKKVAMDMMHT